MCVNSNSPSQNFLIKTVLLCHLTGSHTSSKSTRMGTLCFHLVITTNDTGVFLFDDPSYRKLLNKCDTPVSISVCLLRGVLQTAAWMIHKGRGVTSRSYKDVFQHHMCMDTHRDEFATVLMIYVYLDKRHETLREEMTTCFLIPRHMSQINTSSHVNESGQIEWECFNLSSISNFPLRLPPRS